MINISEEFINSLAPNSNSISNAMSIIRSNKLVKSFISKDGSFIQGECLGSGKENYKPSADFIKPEKPVFRCTCPSRQLPCKHVLGLMFHYLSSKSKFKIFDIPEDIIEKREKQSKREEKKTEKTDKPKKVNKSALAKKLNIQIEGIDILQKFIFEIVKNGFAMMGQKSIDNTREKIRELGNYYLTGPQAKLNSFLNLFEESENFEKNYTKAVDIITGLYSFTKKAKDYLEQRSSDPDFKMDDVTVIEEWLGHAWQLEELKEHGLTGENVELVQLSFNSYVDEGREEEVDEGIWINMSTGEIQITFNYRPFKAKKYIKEEDSFFEVAAVKELFRYPGETNPRIRWSDFTTRPLTAGDHEKIRSFGNSNFPEIIKSVKNQMKNPMGCKTPAVLLNYKKIAKIGDRFVLIDGNGTRLVFDSSPEFADKPVLLNFISERSFSDNTMLVMFTMDIDSLDLRIVPLSIITANLITRFFY
jgi:hypothetical protein